MREKVRIQRILSLLETIWQKQPDVRFNQLVSNLQHIYSIQNEGYGRRKIKDQNFLGEEVDTSYLDFFYLEDEEWEVFLKSIVEKEKADKDINEKSVNDKDKSKNESVEITIAVARLIVDGKTVDQIAEVLSLSPKYVEKIKENLLEGTTLEQLQKEFAFYEKKRAKEHRRIDKDILDSEFKTTFLHKECTHFFIKEKDEEKLSALNLINNKLYPMHYDSEEDDYYVINENGTCCYSIDAVVPSKFRIDLIV